MSDGLHGVGCGYRPELAVDLLRQRELVDFVEVVAETCFAQPSTHRAVLGLRGELPLVPHGVKLSLGSADPGDLDARAARLGALARELGAPCVSEHVALTRAGDRELGHLTPVAPRRALVSVLARNTQRARRHLPDVPLLLENIAWTLRWPDAPDALSDGDFHAEVARATGCPLLLDVANLYANARNAGRDPVAELERFPLDRVAMLHVAGGMLGDDGFYLDTHAHPVPDDVFALVERVLAHCGHVPMVLERDALFPPFGALADELTRLRTLVRSAPAGRTLRANTPAEVIPPQDPSLAREQSSLAGLLLDGGVASVPFAPGEVARTRSVLRHKRLDDAAPLLPQLSLARPGIDGSAFAALNAAPRADERQGVLDAFCVARALCAHHEVSVRDAAARDLLLLRARFHEPDARGVTRPRTGPFVGSVTLAGRRVWALKPPGSHARIRLTA